MQLHYLDIHGVTHTIELYLNFHKFITCILRWRRV